MVNKKRNAAATALVAFLAFAVVTVVAFAATGSATAGGVGARALGMGDAFVAVADDETAVYWNPAGITEIQHFSFVPTVAVSTDEWTDWTDELKAGQPPVVAAGRQADINALVGIATSRFAISELVTTITTAAVPGDGSASLSGTGEAATVITVAVPFRTPFIDLGAIAVGANVKFIQKYQGTATYNPSGISAQTITPVPSASGSGLGFDLGVLARLSHLVQVGVMVRDAYTTVDGMQRPRQIDGGVAVRVPLVGTRLAASLEGYDPGTNSFVSIHLGAEQKLLGLVALRAGLYKEIAPGTLWYTAGAGLSLGPVIVDLGVASDDMFTHRAKAALSAGLRF